MEEDNINNDNKSKNININTWLMKYYYKSLKKSDIDEINNFKDKTFTRNTELNISNKNFIYIRKLKSHYRLYQLKDKDSYIKKYNEFNLFNNAFSLLIIGKFTYDKVYFNRKINYSLFFTFIVVISLFKMTIMQLSSKSFHEKYEGYKIRDIESEISEEIESGNRRLKIFCI